MTPLSLVNTSEATVRVDAASLTAVPTVASNPTSTATAPTQEPLGSAPEWPDIRPHYTITATVDYEAHFVHVQQSLAVTNTTTGPWSELVLQVSPAYWPNFFSLDSSELIINEKAIRPQLTWDVTMLHVALPEHLLPGESALLRLKYGLNLPQLDPVGWGPTGNAGWGADLIQVGDWYPALVPYHQSDGWQTWIYRPVGDPVRSILSDFHVTVVASPEVTVVAAGHHTSDNGVHKFRLRQARAFAFLASPNYIRFEDQLANTPIRVYVLPRHSEMGPVVIAAAAQSLALFTERFGPFPYEELVIAENGFLTAMEYSGLISLSGYAFTAYEGSPDSLLVSITAHEVAHQWWYGAVGSDQVEEPWLDEALAMISELIFYEHYYPELVDWWWYYRVERWSPAGTVDASTSDYEDSATFVHDMYGMAAYFMRDLRTLMGEEAFTAFLQAYYKTHRYGWATTEEFFTVALEFAPAEVLRDLAADYFQDMPVAIAP